MEETREDKILELYRDYCDIEICMNTSLSKEQYRETRNFLEKKGKEIRELLGHGKIMLLPNGKYLFHNTLTLLELELI